MIKRPLKRYLQNSEHPEYPLEELDKHMSDLMRILLGGYKDERSISMRIRLVCKKKGLRRLNPKVSSQPS